MAKYCYENKLSNQNLIAKPNIVWMVDCTSLDLKTFSKIYLFLYIYIVTQNLLSHIKLVKKQFTLNKSEIRLKKTYFDFFFL